MAGKRQWAMVPAELCSGHRELSIPVKKLPEKSHRCHKNQGNSANTVARKRAQRETRIQHLSRIAIPAQPKTVVKSR